MPNIVPANSLVELAQERSYSTKNGWRTVRRFSGLKAQVEARAMLLVQEGYEINLRYGAVCTVEASIGLDVQDENPQIEAPVYNWELMGNAFEMDMLSANITAINGLNAADQKLLRDIIEGRINVGETYSGGDPTFADSSTALPIFKLYLSGVKSVQMFAPVLRRSYSVSRSFQISASLTGAGQVYSTARVVADEGVPTVIAANIPASSQVTKTGAIYMYYGWLKGFPQIQVAAGNKAQVSQEWQWGLWSENLYTKNA